MESVKLESIQYFFEINNKMKKLIYEINPPFYNGLIDEESLCEYTEKLNRLISYIFFELKMIAKEIFIDNIDMYIKVVELEKTIKEEFYFCGTDINKLRFFYDKYISYMNPVYVNAVKKSCVGYSLSNELPINMINSVNELLHLIHSYILNNDAILQTMPVIDKKINNFNYPITLRGVYSDKFKNLFNQFPDELDVGWTDMVVINENKLLMMIRDRGHALTIEISINNDIARLAYFIPKICNIDMVNKLKGINRVNENSVGATGTIEVDVNDLKETLFTFISMVPMDQDMIIEDKIR